MQMNASTPRFAAHRNRAGRPVGRQSSRGVVLVIALILVVVIGVSSAVAIRTSLFGDMVSQNMRAQNLAFQSAELALRYCEGEVHRVIMAEEELGIAVIYGGTEDEWRNETNWEAANAVPDDFLGDNLSYAVTPQCMVKQINYLDAFGSASPKPDSKSPLDQGGFPVEEVKLFRITARGYSPDFRRDDDGLAVAGAMATVQSTIRALP
ncbi:hypothetical protein M8A51_08945 [Schlegelella sp. S2-27]|uniref:Type 4 fimbrial biogenesis protein PilX N-terminal domain-containing protein n=1 Tax=Caldimonas mangrovi TaxID=2944811 RepID=A0ABT0YLQ3_9BURK|nr:hypothetical protein [Caldimonas mangrovi]MCM5679659.1 hypothetical protein [Caldimonas mangrovi]